MILTAVFFRPVRKLSLNTERKSDGDAKAAVNFCLSDFADFFRVGGGGDGGTRPQPRRNCRRSPSYVALTFDDGPRRGTTTRLLDGLRERGASATFFSGGGAAGGERGSGAAGWQAEGHQVGTHTWEPYPTGRIRSGGTSSGTFRQRKTQSARTPGHGVAAGCGRPTASLIRRSAAGVYRAYGPLERGPSGLGKPEYGRWWSGLCWRTVQPGDIILLHDIYATSVEAALQIVDALDGAGVLVCYGGGAAGAERHRSPKRGLCTGPGGRSSVLPHHGHHLAQDLGVGAVDRLVIVIFRQ